MNINSINVCKNCKLFYIAPHKVIALNLFSLFFTLAMYIDSYLLFYIASHRVIALSTITREIVIALSHSYWR